MAQRLIYFNSRDSLIRIDISNIVYFEGDGNYTYLVTANKMKSCLTLNLSHTEEAIAYAKERYPLADGVKFRVFYMPADRLQWFPLFR